nr:hypothetical protein [Carnobacterium maltaromaticum]
MLFERTTSLERAITKLKEPAGELYHLGFITTVLQQNLLLKTDLDTHIMDAYFTQILNLINKKTDELIDKYGEQEGSLPIPDIEMKIDKYKNSTELTTTFSKDVTTDSLKYGMLCDQDDTDLVYYATYDIKEWVNDAGSTYTTLTAYMNFIKSQLNEISKLDNSLLFQMTNSIHLITKKDALNFLNGTLLGLEDASSLVSPFKENY